jgi:hypothetical protein
MNIALETSDDASAPTNAAAGGNVMGFCAVAEKPARVV